MEVSLTTFKRGRERGKDERKRKAAHKVRNFIKSK
jgi:hypothetical protein